MSSCLKTKLKNRKSAAMTERERCIQNSGTVIMEAAVDFSF
jgi:hypothetical protein